MADNISEKFKGLDMGTLIGGPLKAAAEAQKMLEKSTVDFITNVDRVDKAAEVKEDKDF